MEMQLKRFSSVVGRIFLDIIRGKNMFVEQRTYTLVPGSQGEWLEQYEKYGLEIQTEILGRLVGYFSTEFGALNQVVHMWLMKLLRIGPSAAKSFFRIPSGLNFCLK